jgi:hypothetical protein
MTDIKKLKQQIDVLFIKWDLIEEKDISDLSDAESIEDDVAQLIWHYHKTFWPDDELWPNKEALVKFIKEDIGNTAYYAEEF